MATTRTLPQPITIVPEDMNDQEEQDILDVIVPYIQPSSTVSSAEAAQSFDALLLARRARHSPSTSTKTKEYVTRAYIWYAWQTIHKAATQIPHTNTPAHDRLAAFLRALKRLESDVGTLPVENHAKDAYAVWHDMLYFAITIREVDYDIFPDTAACQNLHAYLSRILRDATADVTPHCIRALDHAVGYTFNALQKRKKGRPTVIRDVYPHDGTARAVEVARAWMQIAGQAIWDACRENSGKDGEVGDDAGEWSVHDGLFPKRWGFWRERFGEVVVLQGVRGLGGGIGSTGVDEGTRGHAREARRIMEEIEGRSRVVKRGSSFGGATERTAW